MKKGHPKCVCAPNCKATAAATNKSRKVGSAKKIQVIQMPELRSMRRQNERRPRFEMQNDEPTLIVANYNRRQSASKRPPSIARLDETKTSKNSDNEALIYSQMSTKAPKIPANDTSFETMLRNGEFNDYSITVTPYVEGFYFGNVVSKVFKLNFTQVLNQFY